MRKIIIVAAVVVIALGAGFTHIHSIRWARGCTCTAADGDSRTTEVSCNR